MVLWLVQLSVFDILGSAIKIDLSKSFGNFPVL